MRWEVCKAKIVLLILSLFVGITISRAQTATVNELETSAEYEECKNVATQFYQLWLNKDYRAMYQLLTMEAKLGQIEEEFIGQFQRYKIVDSELVLHPLIPPSLAKNGKIIIVVELRPKQKPPVEQGPIITNFELHLVVDDQKVCKIERVHISIPLMVPNL